LRLPSKRLVSRVYLAVVAVAFVAAVVAQRDELARLLRDARLPVLALALLASYVQAGLSSALWRSALTSFGEPVPFRASLAATLGSLPARYVPGSVWYAVSRVALLSQAGARRSTLAAVAALETVLVPVVGFALGGLLLALTSGTAALTLPLIAGTVLLAVATTPPVVNRLLRLLARLRPSLGVPPVLAWPAHLRLVGWVAAFWCASGSVFALYLSAFPALDAGSPVMIAGAYMVAWGVGWLAVFAPQGIGVFEVTLAALLGGALAGSGLSEGVGGVLVLLAGYRALIAVRDVGAAGLALALRRGAPPAVPRTPPGAAPRTRSTEGSPP
jgi:uncharacterized membrane protein YbhN (UPF0104 family)